MAGCGDAAHVTFALSPSGGSAAALRLESVANGDPACYTNNKSPTRAAFHGLALAMLLGGAHPAFRARLCR